MYNKIKPGSIANTLALHYFDEEHVDAKGLFYFIESWIEKHGLTPSKMGGKGDKNVTFSRGKKALEKSNFDGLKEQGIWIAALPPEDQIGTESFDFIMTGALDYENGYKRNGCVFCWDNTLIPWEDSYIKTLLKDVWKFVKPQYGYAFQREFEKGPGFYPWGVTAGLSYNEKDIEESQKITNWRITGLSDDDDPDYKPHMIRDVYPLNFLSRQHLDGLVGPQTLEQWIHHDPSRGTLEEMIPNFWCWSVPENNLETLKQALIPHDILIAHLHMS